MPPVLVIILEVPTPSVDMCIHNQLMAFLELATVGAQSIDVVVIPESKMQVARAFGLVSYRGALNSVWYACKATDGHTFVSIYDGFFSH